MTTPAEIAEAFGTASAMPFGDAKVAELERLVALADATGEVRLSFDIRIELITTYQHHVERWRLLPAFGWCLATFDRQPELFDVDDSEYLRWCHRWAIDVLWAYPRVDLNRTTASLDDMERRFREGGHSLDAIHNLRCRLADHIGDEPAVEQWYQLWRTAPRDENSDCESCDPTRQAKIMSERGRYDDALALLAPVLAGEIGCGAQPERALATALQPYLRTGHHTEAAAAHVRAYRKHRHDRNDLPMLAEHLRFCAHTGNQQRGLDIVAEHLGWLDRPFDEHSAMEFCAAAALVARRVVETGDPDRTVHRPAHGDRPAADLTATELFVAMADQARDIAGRFDARNGTDHQSRRVERWLTEQPVLESLELPPDRPDLAAVAAALPPEGSQDVLAPLSTEAIVAVLDERGDRYEVEAAGAIGGFWGDAHLWFLRAGERGELLQVRAITPPRFPAQRLADLYTFCNAWNHDRIMPTAYVHEHDDGTLAVLGDQVVDLSHGVAQQQLAAIVDAAIGTSAQLVEDVAKLIE